MVVDDVVGGGIQANALGQLDQALFLQQQKSASLIGRVGRNGNLLGLTSAATSQREGENTSDGSGCARASDARPTCRPE